MVLKMVRDKEVRDRLADARCVTILKLGGYSCLIETEARTAGSDSDEFFHFTCSFHMSNT